jgi:hypothetical protein
VGALGWIGVGLIIFGVFWAFMMWWAATFRAPAGPTLGVGYGVADALKALAEALRALAALLKLNYGAPVIVMLIGLTLVIIDAS